MISAPNGSRFNSSTCKRELMETGFTEEQAKVLVKYLEKLYNDAKSNYP